MLLSDPEIAALMAEEKPEVEPGDLLHTFVTPDAKQGHRRHAVTVDGAAGNRFQLRCGRASMTRSISPSS